MNKSKTTDSYQNIMEQARQLFLKHGIQRVSVQEICKEARVSKMTFYRAFKNKEDVAETVLRELTEKSMESYRAIMKQDIPFAQRIEQMIAWKQTAAAEFSEEFIKGIYNLKDSTLKNQLENHRQAARKEVMDDMETAQKNGWIRKDIKLSFILFMLHDMDEKMKDENFLAMYTDIREAGMELTKFFFNGILPNEKIQ